MKGYYRNSIVNQENHIVLQDASKKIDLGEEIETIELKKLPDISYSGEQPYMEGSDYILYWMKEYYRLPEKVKIIYK